MFTCHFCKRDLPDNASPFRLVPVGDPLVVIQYQAVELCHDCLDKQMPKLTQEGSVVPSNLPEIP